VVFIPYRQIRIFDGRIRPLRIRIWNNGGNYSLIGYLATDVGRSTVNIGISKKGASSVKGGDISDQNTLSKRGVFDGRL